jgi:predicted secreted Zn-dependent protease
MTCTSGIAGGWALRGLALTMALLLGAAPPPQRAPSPPPATTLPQPAASSPSLAIAALAATSPIIRVSEEFYDIRGSTAQALSLEMRRLGPSSEAGQRHSAYTAWNINWRFHPESRGPACMASWVEVKAEIVITLPRWDPPPEASRELRWQWDTYLAALRAHEEGHRDLAVAAGQQVHIRISGFLTASCQDFGRLVRREAHRILDQLRADDRRYDEETRSGARQGAVWPPPRG